MPTADEQTKLTEGAGGFVSDLAVQSGGQITRTLRCWRWRASTPLCWGELENAEYDTCCHGTKT